MPNERRRLLPEHKEAVAHSLDPAVRVPLPHLGQEAENGVSLEAVVIGGLVTIART